MVKVKVMVAILVLVTVVLGGCGNAEKAAAAQAQKAQEFTEQARRSRSEAKFDDAATAYTKALEIKADVTVKVELEETKYEQQSVQKVKEFRAKLYDIQKTRTRSGITVKPTDMEFVLKDMRMLIEDFNKVDDTRDTDIARYAKSIKEGFAYKMMLLAVEDKFGVFKDAGEAEGLSTFSPQLSLTMTMAVAFSRNQINPGIDEVMAKKLPSKYDQ